MKIYLVRCPKCGRENAGPAVASGVCCWCGYSAVEEDCKVYQRRGFCFISSNNQK